MLKVGDSFAIELSVKPRVESAVLLAVSAGMGDYLTVQLLKGGQVLYSHLFCLLGIV